MTNIDDAMRATTDILKSVDECVAAFNAMNAESRGRLQQWFPSLNVPLSRLTTQWQANVSKP